MQMQEPSTFLFIYLLLSLISKYKLRANKTTITFFTFAKNQSIIKSQIQKASSDIYAFKKVLQFVIKKSKNTNIFKKDIKNVLKIFPIAF